MAYVVTQSCCKDASCVPVCPVDCIRPVGGAALSSAEMLYIDPDTCVDCGACEEECPVDAIRYEDDLSPEQARFKDLNAAYFQRHPLQPEILEVGAGHSPVAAGALRVAVVGAGPAACYAAMELIAIDGVEVDLFERLPTPFGLVRAGVAPDHQPTKSIVKTFARALADPRLGCHFNVEIGRDLTHDDLLAHHHAVIYAVGASSGRELGIPGEDLAGVYSAADFVGWYNGHPSQADHALDLSGERAVIVGNGNVALDVARVLTMRHEDVARTDIADHALDALSRSNIREVVVLGRRGPRQAAFSVSEFLALGHLPGVDVCIEGGDLNSHPDDDVQTAAKLDLAREYAARPTVAGNKRIVFRFLAEPVGLLGSGHVEAVQLRHNTVDDDGSVISQGGEAEGVETLPATLVVRSTGYRGTRLPGLEFDEEKGVVPNDGGRVLDADGRPVAGVYVTGWIKRGPRGVIGTNRSCAIQTVARLLADLDSGVLDREVGSREALEELMADRGVQAVNWSGWRAIDAAERQRGDAASRPRVKFVTVDQMLGVAKA